MPSITHLWLVGALICVPMLYGSFEFPASAELEPTFTQAEVDQQVRQARIEGAREAFSARECGWREFLTEQPRKKS